MREDRAAGKDLSWKVFLFFLREFDVVVYLLYSSAISYEQLISLRSLYPSSDMVWGYRACSSANYWKFGLSLPRAT